MALATHQDEMKVVALPPNAQPNPTYPAQFQPGPARIDRRIELCAKSCQSPFSSASESGFQKYAERRAKLVEQRLFLLETNVVPR